MRFVLAAVACITLSSTADARGFLIPPLEIDLGVGAPVGADVERLAPSTEIQVGVHWASLAWKPTRLDVGIGYTGSFRMIDDPARFEDQELRVHGGYFALGTRIASGSHWRTFVVARGELLRATHDTREFSAIGAALRVSTELFGNVATGDRNTAILGTVALGIYVEATYRDLPSDLGPVGFTSGISCRLPFMVAGS